VVRLLSLELGSHTLAERLIIRWPNGETQQMMDVGVDRILTVRRRSLTKLP
jgi:hypothetical protein